MFWKKNKKADNKKPAINFSKIIENVQKTGQSLTEDTAKAAGNVKKTFDKTAENIKKPFGTAAKTVKDTAENQKKKSSGWTLIDMFIPLAPSQAELDKIKNNHKNQGHRPPPGK